MAGSKPARAARLQRAWRSRSGLARWLLPLSWLYGALVGARRYLYDARWLKSFRPPIPVVVVGNVVVGGAGKTPVTISVIEHLQEKGWSPGLVSRGYGRNTTGLAIAQPSRPDSWNPDALGDEPALIARRCGVPVAVAEQRSIAARALLEQHPQIDVLVCDDGLQHLALARDIDICVWGACGVGNGWLLPAGPLREPWPRPVDLVLYAGEVPPPGPAPAFRMWRRLASHAKTALGESMPLTTMTPTATDVETRAHPSWVAIAGTAQPEEFFTMLRDLGMVLEDTLALPDHFNFDSWSPNMDKHQRLICTEKDAIKLWPRFPGALAVRLELDIAPGFFTALDARLAAWIAKPQN